MAMREWMLVLAAASSLGLAACDRARQDTGSQTAGQQSPAGTSGAGGTAAMGGPGAGLAGGMNPSPGQATGVANGSTNRTTKGSVGNR
ncbi:MAG TPA: hypothetical protein VIE63_14405 [Ramlibacter sp.]|jgi:hypothetical protein